MARYISYTPNRPPPHFPPFFFAIVKKKEFLIYPTLILDYHLANQTSPDQTSQTSQTSQTRLVGPAGPVRPVRPVKMRYTPHTHTHTYDFVPESMWGSGVCTRNSISLHRHVAMSPCAWPSISLFLAFFLAFFFFLLLLVVDIFKSNHLSRFSCPSHFLFHLFRKFPISTVQIWVGGYIRLLSFLRFPSLSVYLWYILVYLGISWYISVYLGIFPYAEVVAFDAKKTLI